MKKMRFSAMQTIGVLKHAGVGVPVAEEIREAGISKPRSTGGMQDIDDGQRAEPG